PVFFWGCAGMGDVGSASCLTSPRRDRADVLRVRVMCLRADVFRLVLFGINGDSDFSFSSGTLQDSHRENTTRCARRFTLKKSECRCWATVEDGTDVAGSRT